MNSTVVTSLPENAPAVKAAKWIALVEDRLVPMPRRTVTTRLIKEQAGMDHTSVLVRDHNSPHDTILPDHVGVDLAEGNVFYGVPAGELVDRPPCDAPPKLAYAVNDQWKVVTLAEQTGRTLRELFALDTDVVLLRDYESPHDVSLADDDAARFSDGPVLRTQGRKQVVISVNNREVTVREGPATALQIKQAAIAQQVSICLDCVLYAIKPDGNHSAAIRDHERVEVKCGAQFRCIAPDDNS